MIRKFPPAFVTFGWCRTACIAVWSLGQKGIDVHVGDESSLAMSRFSRYCKSFTKLPNFYTQPDEYFEEVCKAVKKTGAKVLLPCHEDTAIFSKRQHELPQDVHIAVPDADMYDLAEDQSAFEDYVRKNGCPAPETFRIATLSQLEQLGSSVTFPVVIKTRIGNSAKGVRIARNAEELHEKFHELIGIYNLRPTRWPVIQKFLPGDKIGVIAVCNRGKHISVVPFHIQRSKGAGNLGTSTFRVTISDPVITENAIRALKALNWHGVVDMDWVKDCNGVAQLIDINGRLGGATALTVFAGVDVPYLWYLTALAEEVNDPPSPRINVKSRWFLGDSLGLLDLIRRGRIRDSLKLLTVVRKCHHDDFNFRDPAPFVFEALDYFVKFLKAGGSMNPVTEGMIR